MKFFSPDSKFAQVMTSVGEMMLLNLCWIIGCLPLVTAGAANAAMYTLMGRRLRGEGRGTVIPFFKAWWSNLKTGTLFWMAQVLVSGSLGSINADRTGREVSAGRCAADCGCDVLSALWGTTANRC